MSVGVGLVATVVVLMAMLANGRLPGMVDVPFPNVTGWVVAAMMAAIYVGSLLAHEFGHAFAARSRGVPVFGVDLGAVGGVTRMAAIRDPEVELRVIAAGPVMNLGLAAAAALGQYAALLAAAGPVVAALFGWAVACNVVLGLGNLVPVVPLDGGRLVIAWRWARTGDQWSAQRFVARCGETLGWMVAAAPVSVWVFSGEFGWESPLVVSASGAVWSLVAGTSLIVASRLFAVSAASRAQLAGVSVAQLWPSTVTIDGAATAGSIDPGLLAGSCAAFVVAGESTGVVSAVALSRAARREPSRPVGELMSDAALPADTPALTAVDLFASGVDAVLIVDGDGPVGALAPVDFLRGPGGPAPRRATGR